MIQILNIEPIENLEVQALYSSGKLKVLPFSFWKEFSKNQIKLFMLKHGIYFIPTTEVITYLKPFFNKPNKGIEIGCGNGSLGRELNIPITDSMLQLEPFVMAAYIAAGQPPIKYPSDVIKLEAEAAIKKYIPDVVIGSFITHKYNGIDGNMFGVKEENIIKYIDTYIMIGNKQTHGRKPILKKNHEEVYMPELITRSENQLLNRIFIWKKK